MLKVKNHKIHQNQQIHQNHNQYSHWKWPTNKPVQSSLSIRKTTFKKLGKCSLILGKEGSGFAPICERRFVCFTVQIYRSKTRGRRLRISYSVYLFVCLSLVLSSLCFCLLVCLLVYFFFLFSCLGNPAGRLNGWKSDIITSSEF